jgi:TatD DNase family protein
MLLIDTHLHLYAEEFDDDRRQVIDNALTAGVGQLLLPNIDSTTIESMMSLARQYPDVCFPMMGLHPCYVKENYKKELAIVEKKLLSGEFYGVGEIGMDKYWDLTFIKEQEEALRIQLILADQLQLPVALHTRNCTSDVLDIIDSLKLKNLTGIFHCFGGTPEEAKRVINIGMYLGIGGVVTFKNGGLDQVLTDIDLKQIVLETDGPYLAPVPFRGKRNQPAYLKHIAEKISEIKKCSLQEVADITSANARNLFGI